MDQPGNLGKKLETTTLRASPIELACKGISQARRKRAVRAYRPLCVEAMTFFATNGWLFTFHTRLDCEEGYAASWARVVRQRKIKVKPMIQRVWKAKGEIDGGLLRNQTHRLPPLESSSSFTVVLPRPIDLHTPLATHLILNASLLISATMMLTWTLVMCL